ncbi:MAG: FeS-binding protein [SAR324 cluster bacterium]|uniref:FeS-binding protein n=1 Tax=SAR324 cluster bacterium TaxID=2024889 RepID=A0A2A4T2C3_9DELT|nr:MAG: FeS-binding protein [SAR324 cluster bacterium]
MSGKILTLAIMDGPYESTCSTTAFRIIDAALRKGHSVKVFAYEGAVSLTMKAQKEHPNPAHGTSAEDEHHVLTKRWVEGLYELAKKHHVDLDWVNCGLCVDERGAGDWVVGPTRGGPADFLTMVENSTNTLVIPSKRNS